MPPFMYPPISFYRGTFSIFIAPSSITSEALNNYLTKEYGKVLTITGEISLVLSRIVPREFHLRKEQVSEGCEIFGLLQKATEPLILIEHTQSLYNHDADAIRAIALLARKKVSRNQSIFMFGTRLDEWLMQFEPFAHKLTYIDGIFPEISRKNTNVIQKTAQITLDTIL